MADPFTEAVASWLAVAGNGESATYSSAVHGDIVTDNIYIDARMQVVDDIGSVATRAVAIFAADLFAGLPSTADTITKGGRTWDVTGYVDEYSDSFYHAVYLT